MVKKAILSFCLFLLFLSSSIKALDVKEEIKNAACIYFSGNIYLYGFEQKSNELYLKVACYSTELQKINETSLLLEHTKFDKFHPIAVDTIHDYLNFTVQRIDNDKTAKVIRLSKKLETIAVIKDAEISRINSFAAFEDEKLYTKNNLFIIHPASKDSANMFFLQKFHLLDSSKVFEYKLDWQFGFDKNKYKRCRIITLNKKYIFIYANILAGGKKGQWVLMINLKTGEADLACKLNEGMDTYELLYSNYCYNQLNKELTIAGVKLMKPAANNEQSKLDFSIAKLKALNVFICTIDSVGKIKEKKFDFMPIPLEMTKEKEFKNYVLKTSKIAYQNEEFYLLNEVIAEASPKLYKTYGYLFTHLIRDEYGALKIEQSVFDATYTDPKLKLAKQITNNYEAGKPGELDKLLYKSPLFSAFSNFVWDIQYTSKTLKATGQHQNNASGKITFYNYTLKDKKWENKEFFSGEKLLKNKCLVLSTKKYIAFSAVAPNSPEALPESCLMELKEF